MSRSRLPTDLRIADILTFLAVRRSGSITGAARQVRVTASQVSKAITRLEEQLRVKLLLRSARGVTLSDGALRVLPDLEEIVARLERLSRSGVQEITALTIAAPSYLNAAFFPNLVG